MPEQLSVDAGGVAQSPAAAPVATDQRIHTLDILRGLALFGMILVHFHQHTRREATGVEDLIGWGVWIFAEQKAWGTFAFLFGVGFAVLLRRLDARGEAATSIYLRRLVALAAFGVVAEVGFGFQILFEYAYWGLALLLIRRLSTPKLLTVAVASACAAPMIAATSALYAWWTAATSKDATTQNLLRSATDAAHADSYSTLLAARWAVFVHALPHNWRAVVPTMSFTLFVLGMLALRLGVLENPRRHLRLIRSFMMFGALSWAASWVFTLFVQQHLPTISIPGLAWPLFSVFGIVQDQWLCLTYIGAVVLLLAYRSQWIARLSLFGVAGRMALTNYMLQVAALDVLSSGYGFSLRLRPYVYVVAAVLLFAVEVALSRAWLARFRFGPLEWLWRSITYARWQPLRRRQPETLMPAAA